MPFSREGRWYNDPYPETEADVASAARTANGTSAVFETADVTALMSTVYVSAVSGTSPSMTVTLQTSIDGGTSFYNVAAFPAITTVVVPPVQSAPSTATSGGTLAAATYFYVVTAINANGETTASNELSQATTGAVSTVTVNWAAATGATGYKIYRGTAAGGETLIATVGAVVTYTDTGAANLSARPPVVNTTAAAGQVFGPLGDTSRWSWAISGTTPSFTFAIGDRAKSISV